jgi:hypothetical protein
MWGLWSVRTGKVGQGRESKSRYKSRASVHWPSYCELL